MPSLLPPSGSFEPGFSELPFGSAFTGPGEVSRASQALQRHTFDVGDLTFEQLEAEVRRLAGERPDFIYNRTTGGFWNGNAACVYNATEDREGCIFGQALTRLGRPVPEGLEHVSIRAILEHASNMYLTTAQGKWTQAVQGSQDTGLSWSEAVERADRIHPIGKPVAH